jgi:hypothetical protein
MNTYHAAFWSSDPSRLSSSDEEEEDRDKMFTFQLHLLSFSLANLFSPTFWRDKVNCVAKVDRSTNLSVSIEISEHLYGSFVLWGPSITMTDQCVALKLSVNPPFPQRGQWQRVESAGLAFHMTSSHYGPPGMRLFDPFPSILYRLPYHLLTVLGWGESCSGSILLPVNWRLKSSSPLQHDLVIHVQEIPSNTEA